MISIQIPRNILVYVALALAVFLFVELMPVLSPFLVALLVAYLLNPVIWFLQKKFGLNRGLAVTSVFLLFFSTIGLLLFFLLPLLWEQLLYAKSNIPEAVKWFNSEILPLVNKYLKLNLRHIDLSLVTKLTMEYAHTHYNFANTQSLLLSVASQGLSFASILGVAVLVPVVAFYYMMDWQAMLGEFKALLPRRIVKVTWGILQECNAVIHAFVKGQLLVMFILGCFYVLALTFLGLKLALILGVVIGVLSIIPYFGFAVGLISASVAILFQYGIDIRHLGGLVIVFVVGNVIEGYVLQPYLLGDKIGLSPVAVIFSVVVGGQVGGITGMLFALPVAAVIFVLLKHLKAYYLNSEFYLAPSYINDEVTVPVMTLTEEVTPEAKAHTVDLDQK